MNKLQTYTGVVSNDTEEWSNICREIDSKFSKMYTSMGCFWPNYNVWAKIVQRSYGWLSVPNWYEEFDEFWPEYSKISKNLPFNGLLFIKV